MKFREVNNNCDSLTRKQRKSYEERLLELGDKTCKKSYIRLCSTDKVAIPPALRNYQGDLITKPSDIADVFAEEFQKAYCIEPDFNQCTTLTKTNKFQNSLCDIIFTVDDV